MPAGLREGETGGESVAGPILLTTDAVGGVWHYSLALAEGLSAAGCRVFLAVVGPPPGPWQTLAAAAIPGCTLVSTGLDLDWTTRGHAGLAAIADGLAGLAAAHRVASVHLHAPCLAGFDYGVPVVCVAHSCIATWWDAVHRATLPADLAWHAAATRDGIVRADAAIAPTAAFAAQLTRIYAVDPVLHVIHNGAPLFDRSGNLYRQARAQVVLTAGRLWDAGKNVAMLDRAASRMRGHIFAVGPVRGPHGAHLSVNALHVNGAMRHDALRRMMLRVAVFASPSLYEPFGLAVLEAAQAGVALVLADTPGFRELWADAAIYLPPEGAEDLWAQCLDALVDDPAACRTLGDAARGRAQRYTQAAMAQATLRVHADVIRRRLQAA